MEYVQAVKKLPFCVIFDRWFFVMPEWNGTRSQVFHILQYSPPHVQGNPTIIQERYFDFADGQ